MDHSQADGQAGGLPGNEPAGSVRGSGAARDTGAARKRTDARPHKSFLERQHATPTLYSGFYKTREGRQVILLMIGLSLIGIVALRYQGRAPEIVEKAFANVPVQLTPEQIAERDRKLEERRRANSVLFEGALSDSQNGTDFAETAGYLRLLDIVTAYTADEVAAKITGLMKPEDVKQEPDLYRGEFVRVRGVVAGLMTVKLDVASASHTEVFRGVVTQPDGESGAVAFDLVSPPPKFDLQRTVVDVEGVLYRTVRYQTRTGKVKRAAREVFDHDGVVEIPWMIARTMKIADLPPATGIATVLTGKSTWILPILGLAAVGFWFVLRRAARNSRRKDPARAGAVGFHEMFQERLREEQSRKDSTSSGSSP